MGLGWLASRRSFDAMRAGDCTRHLCTPGCHLIGVGDLPPSAAGEGRSRLDKGGAGGAVGGGGVLPRSPPPPAPAKVVSTPRLHCKKGGWGERRTRSFKRRGDK